MAEEGIKALEVLKFLGSDVAVVILIRIPEDRTTWHMDVAGIQQVPQPTVLNMLSEYITAAMDKDLEQ